MPRQSNSTGPSLSHLFGLGRLGTLVMLLITLSVAAVVGAVVFAPEGVFQNVPTVALPLLGL